MSLHPENTSNPESPPVKSISLRDILRILFCQKWVIISISFTLFLIVVFFVFSQPEIYRSDARILLRVGRENISVDPAVIGSTMGVSRNRENEINSELNIITSRNVIEKVVDTLGVDTVLGGGTPTEDTDAVKRRAFAIHKVERDLHAEGEKKSNNIILSYYSNSPELAQLILSTTLQVYQARHIEIYRSKASLDFFQSRVNKLLERIKKKEAILVAFQKEHNLTDPVRQQQLLTDQIMSMQKRSDDIKRQLVALYARRAVLEKNIKSCKPYAVTSRVSGMPNRTAESLKERLVALRIKESDILAQYPPTSSMRQQLLPPILHNIKVVEDSLKNETDTLTEETTAIDTTYQALTTALRQTETSLSELSAEQSSLAPLLDERLEQRARMIDAEHDMQDIQRDIKFDWDEYNQYRKGLQRAKVSAALDIDQISNVSIVQSATLPMKPVSPDKLRDLILGLILSVMTGLGIGIVREHFDDTLKSETDVRDRLGQVVLANLSIEEFKQCR